MKIEIRETIISILEKFRNIILLKHGFDLDFNKILLEENIECKITDHFHLMLLPNDKVKVIYKPEGQENIRLNELLLKAPFQFIFNAKYVATYSVDLDSQSFLLPQIIEAILG